MPGAAQTSEVCRRCKSSGPAGNVCFLSDGALRAYCQDQAELKKHYLVRQAAALPDDGQRRRFFEGLLRHQSSAMVQDLRRRTWRLLGGAEPPAAPQIQHAPVQEALL